MYLSSKPVVISQNQFQQTSLVKTDQNWKRIFERVNYKNRILRHAK